MSDDLKQKIMNEMNNIDELEQMRIDLGGFKSQLKQQKIFNEKIMRRAMQKDYSKERNTQWTVVGLTVVAIPVLIALAYFTGVFPVWFLVLTAIVFLSCIGITVYRTRRYVSDNVMTGNVLTVAENMVACKRFDYRTLMFFSLPAIIIWAVPFFWLTWQNGGEFARSMLCGGIIGGIIGGILGAIYYRDSVKRINRIIEQLEEIKETRDNG